MKILLFEIEKNMNMLEIICYNELVEVSNEYEINGSREYHKMLEI